MPGLMDLMRAAMRRNIGETLSVPQFRCLGFVSRNAGCSVSDVAAFLGVTLATASALVDRLAKADCVQSHMASADRRRMEIHMKPAGKSLLTQIERGAKREFAERLSRRSASERAAVMSGLAVLREAFDHEA